MTFTDVNGDGRVEATVAYHMFCGGGIDTHTVKVILREGATKLAIRGESTAIYPGQEPFGGESSTIMRCCSPIASPTRSTCTGSGGTCR